jgi:hypothetical protein
MANLNTLYPTWNASAHTINRNDTLRRWDRAFLTDQIQPVRMRMETQRAVLMAKRISSGVASFYVPVSACRYKMELELHTQCKGLETHSADLCNLFKAAVPTTCARLIRRIENGRQLLKHLRILFR